MQDSFGLVGSTIAGKYRVQEVVGEGGFGLVYRGNHLGFDQSIAVKCLKVPPHFTGDARRLFIERFAEEGKLLFRLSEHRSIVRVFDHAVMEIYGQQVPYLVLEWLEGISLHDYIEQRQRACLPPMSEVEALRLLRDPVDGLALAHQMRVAHRDIKPENLFLVRSSTGTVTKLLDFGVAKLMEDADAATQYATATSSGFRAFSPQYGAPEQFFSKEFGQTGPWTDVHAIGLLLSELVSGRPAFDGSEFGEFYNRALADARPTPQTRGAVVTPEFDALCAKALALETRDRFRNAGELLAAMDACLAAAEVPARRFRLGSLGLRGKARWLATALLATAAAAGAAMAWPPGRGSGSQSIRPLDDPSHVVPPDANPVELPGSTLSPPTQAARGPGAQVPVDAGLIAPAVLPDAAVTPAPPDSLTGSVKSDDAVVKADDGTEFRIGDTVFVRQGDTKFVRGRIGALRGGRATVDGADVSLDDVSPAELSLPSWEAGTMVLVGSGRNSTMLVGKVTAAQDSGLTLRLWNGRKLQSVRYSNAESGTGNLGKPIRVRRSWQAPLARALVRLAQVQPSVHPNPNPNPVPPRPHPDPDPPPPQVDNSRRCADHCVGVAGQEKGTPGYAACMAGCH